jgi:hypothetical protein
MSLRVLVSQHQADMLALLATDLALDAHDAQVLLETLLRCAGRHHEGSAARACLLAVAWRLQRALAVGA